MQLTIHARPKFMILMKEDDAQIYCCIIRHCIDVSSNQDILIVKAFGNLDFSRYSPISKLHGRQDRLLELQIVSFWKI